MGNQGILGLQLIFICFYLVATTYTCFSVGNMSVVCFEQERLALLNFKHSVRDEFGMLSSWVGNDCCMWEGIHCDGVTKNVESVHLRATASLKNLVYESVTGSIGAGHYLVGDEVNSSLAELRHLKYLDLSGNDFQGSRIPDFIGSFKQLIYLNFSNAHFHGMFPHHIGNLSNLKVIDLSSTPIPVVWYNRLTGPIPESVGRLRLLEVLDLSYNLLTGPLPTFLGNLTKLNLSHNQLSGSISKFFEKLGALTHLDLGSNRLSGTIPASLGRFVSLQTILLSSNLFSGSIPVSIGQLAKLHSLDISNNSFEGVVFEAHLANLPMLKLLDTSSNTKLTFNVSHNWIPPFQLKTLQLSSCNIKNEFPQWLRSQMTLETLALSNATLSGPLPTWLRKRSIIPFLDLSHNKLSGPLKNLPSGESSHVDVIGSLFLEDNLFNESIPMSLCRWTNLRYLDLSRNRLTGKIPKCLGNLKYLFNIVLSSNRLSGVIPSSIALRSLTRLNLNDNNFIGALPREFEDLYLLNVLDLGNNKLSGNIPEWIGEELTSLMVLRLHKNNFTGKIPQSLCWISDLRILDVAYNNLMGTIPRCLGKLSAMAKSRLVHQRDNATLDHDENVIQSMKGVDREYTKTWDIVFNMDLSSNKLVGEIPIELSALSMLVGLNLSNNRLSGGIPYSIGNMSKVESLDFSNNELTGMIPASMAALNFLSHLNLSNNNLSGQIPTGNQLQTLTDPSIYAGNKDLCGAPLPNNCSNHEDPTKISKKKYKSFDLPTKVWLFYMDIICGYATGFWGVILVLFFKKQWRHKLFMFAEETMDKIYVVVVVKVSMMKTGKEVV